MEETATISLKRLKRLELCETALNKRKSLLITYGEYQSLSIADDNEVFDLLIKKIVELQKEKESECDILREQIRKQYTVKPWWKF